MVSRLKSPTSLYRPTGSGIGGATAAARIPNGQLGRSQAVRQRILIPPFGGSIPPAPASNNTLNLLPERLCPRGGFGRFWKWFSPAIWKFCAAFVFHRILREMDS